MRSMASGHSHGFHRYRHAFHGYTHGIQWYTYPWNPWVYSHGFQESMVITTGMRRRSTTNFKMLDFTKYEAASCFEIAGVCFARRVHFEALIENGSRVIKHIGIAKMSAHFRREVMNEKEAPLKSHGCFEASLWIGVPQSMGTPPHGLGYPNPWGGLHMDWTGVAKSMGA